MNYLIKPSFQGVNRFFVLSFENENDRTSHSTYDLPKVEIKDYNVMIDGRNFFDQPINSMNKTYENIRKIRLHNWLIGNYFYFKENYKLIAIDLIKQHALDEDSRAIQQINFTANLDKGNGATMFFVIEQAKETVFQCSQGTVKVL